MFVVDVLSPWRRQRYLFFRMIIPIIMLAISDPCKETSSRLNHGERRGWMEAVSEQETLESEKVGVHTDLKIMCSGMAMLKLRA